MIYGVDTSKAAMGPHRADWRALPAEVRFVILRMAFSADVDEFGTLNYDAARASGRAVGGYLFPSVPCTKHPHPSELEVQYAAWLALWKRYAKPGDLPWALDVEFPDGFVGGGYSKHMTNAQYVALIGGLAEKWERDTGMRPLLYTSDRVWHEDLKDTPSPRIARLPVWVSRAPLAGGQLATFDERRIDAAMASSVAHGHLPLRAPKPWRDAGQTVAIQQYQENATLPGFGTVDMNRARPEVIDALCRATEAAAA
jgi:hypothetical protein